jgi:tellurite resistance protein TehA-like permease
MMGFGFGTGVPFVSIREYPLEWFGFALLLGFVVVSSAISREYPTIPIILWAIFELTWMVSSTRHAGLQRGISMGLRASIFPAVYLALAACNFGLVRRSEQQSAKMRI